MKDTSKLRASSASLSVDEIEEIELMFQGQFFVLEELVSLIVVSWQRKELTDREAEEFLMAAEEAIEEIEWNVFGANDGGIALGCYVQED